MKPRLFWTMLLAFVLVIAMGVAGMLGFFGLAFAGIWQPIDWRDSSLSVQRVYVDSLGDYYVAHGNSWAGVDQRLTDAPFIGPMSLHGYALADAGGRVVASGDND